jgi:hypothetical protein
MTSVAQKVIEALDQTGMPYVSCLTTSWTQKNHDIVDSIIEQMSQDIVDTFAQSPINID